MTSHHATLFSKAYILGGSPCSGKSTTAEMLAAKYGFQYYRADNHDRAHMQRSQPDLQPVMFKISRMSWEEIWSRSVADLLKDEIAYYREGFSFILDDLCQFDLETPVILEGAAFLPDLIHQYPVLHHHVVYMIPAIAFQLHHYQKRPWIHGILKECRDPRQAFANWMKRDEFFGQEVIRQANLYGFPVIVVDGSADIDMQFKAVERQFRLVDV